VPAAQAQNQGLGAFDLVVCDEAHRTTGVTLADSDEYVKTDKASGIVNDPNDWSREVGDPRYILDLLARVVTVSVVRMSTGRRSTPRMTVVFSTYQSIDVIPAPRGSTRSTATSRPSPR
jgi:predicted helicase